MKFAYIVTLFFSFFMLNFIQCVSVWSWQKSPLLLRLNGPKTSLNQFSKSRQQMLRAYYPEVYNVAAAVNKGKSSTTNAKKCTSSSPPILHPSTQFASLSLTPISDILHYTSHQAIICM